MVTSILLINIIHIMSHLTSGVEWSEEYCNDDCIHPGMTYHPETYDFENVCSMTQVEIEGWSLACGTWNTTGLYETIRTFCETKNPTYDGHPVSLSFGHIYESDDVTNNTKNNCLETYLIQTTDADPILYAMIMGIDLAVLQASPEMGEAEYAPMVIASGLAHGDRFPFKWLPMPLNDLVSEGNDSTTAIPTSAGDGASSDGDGASSDGDGASSAGDEASSANLAITGGITLIPLFLYSLIV